MRILGIDYGKKRIGIAVCDELGITTRGVATIYRTNLEKDIAQIEVIAKDLGVEKIVIGYPLGLDGTRGVLCEEIDNFIGHLKKKLSSLPIIMCDETLTTKGAEELMVLNKVKAKKRKDLVDKIAACLILENYLYRLKLSELSLSEVR